MIPVACCSQATLQKLPFEGIFVLVCAPQTEAFYQMSNSMYLSVNYP